MDIRMRSKKLFAYVDEGCFGRGDFQIIEQSPAQKLIDKHAPVLRIVAKLDDIPMAVVGFEEVGLRAASHLADVADGGERHRKRLVT
jgi:hypothetical protein